MSFRSVITKLWRYGQRAIHVQKRLPIKAKESNPVAGLTGGGSPALGASGLQRGFDSARRIFVNNLLRRVTSASNGLRERTTRQLLFGNSVPFFAFVGINLASGSIISKEDELEGLCWEIKNSILRMQQSYADAESDIFHPDENVDLDRFTIGPNLGIGSFAAVYAAKLKSENENQFEPNQNINAFPYAIKMMFNFGIESVSTLILREMVAETLPARWSRLEQLDDEYCSNTINLPPHPNIVAIHQAFTDRFPEDIPGAKELFPGAMPKRLNPGGFGRNMTLYILMKRYHMNLGEYLSQHELNQNEATLIFAQIIEAVAHINRHGIAHRDIKSDNFLIELGTEGDPCPRVVLSDFGCCLADRTHGLRVPYSTYETLAAGNPVLRAPEIALAKPGLMNYFDFTKSDGWAAATIAYELFTGQNPFYPDKNGTHLVNKTYTEENLPDLDAPRIVEKVIKSLLIKKSSQRITAEFAADVIQLYKWAPSSWLKLTDYPRLPDNTEIMQWLLNLRIKVGAFLSVGKRRSQAEYELICSFLGRLNFSRLKRAIAFAQSC